MNSQSSTRSNSESEMDEDASSEKSMGHESSSESETETSQPSIITFAIDEVLKENNQASLKQMTKLVLKKLSYYFKIKRNLEDSDQFVESIDSKAETMQSYLGGRTESVFLQALESYKTFIREEIKSSIETGEEESTMEDSDSSDNESETDMDSVVKESETDMDSVVKESKNDKDTDWASLK
jgi:hypothetical protein